MSLSALLTAGKVPTALTGRTLVVAEAATLERAEGFLAGLEARLGPLALGVTGEAAYTGPRAHVPLPERYGADRKRLARLRPRLVVILGRTGAAQRLLPQVQAPCAWVNAPPEAPAQGCRLITVAAPQQTHPPGAVVTGDPLADLPSLPTPSPDTGACERFREYRERGHWVFYAAGTGEGEEELAYGLLFELLRGSSGIMLLAPRDAARLDRVYHEALKYHLPTIRHSRLYTSYVPRKNRVYYIEDPAFLDQAYPCADLVIAGGTLHPQAGAAPDLVTPMLAGRPVLVGPRRNEALVAAAVEAGVVGAAEDVEGLAARARELLEAPGEREALAGRARAWLERQPGARRRVLDLLAGLAA